VLCVPCSAVSSASARSLQSKRFILTVEIMATTHCSLTQPHQLHYVRYYRYIREAKPLAVEVRINWIRSQSVRHILCGMWLWV